MKLADTILCTFGGGGGDMGHSTMLAPHHPENPWKRDQQRKGGPDKAGVAAESKGVVCFDFDGVLSAYDGWQGKDKTGAPIKKAVALAQKLQQEGFTIVVLTARTDLKRVNQWLQDNGLGFAKATNKKPPALVYIDDRAVRWPATNKEVLQKIKGKSLKAIGAPTSGSSLISRDFLVVDGMGRVLHRFKTKEEAQQASAGNRYTKVVSEIPPSDTPEVRDMIRGPKVRQATGFRRTMQNPDVDWKQGAQ